ncbi:MAG: glycine C-acetyltransferase, partial [Spirochaetales bacterium]|nr:glycine C-acetyltransferase [Spirochaetales bacterium]
AAKAAMDKWGYGLSSVRFICGTQKLHKMLEQAVSHFLRTDDTILFSSCFDANAAVFEPLLNDQDAIISDALNHASIIDGVRLCKAKRWVYKHADMEDLERCLKESAGCRRVLIATDGVFSMDGDVCRLDSITDLAEKYHALVMVDESHSSGYIGATGRGSMEYHNVFGKVDIITTTFGKALGGASGGCISGRKEIIDLYRQRARPYLFSNTLAPAICGGTLKVLELLENGNPFREKIMKNAESFRSQMKTAGFDLVPGDTAIVPVMLYDEVKAVRMASELLNEGIYVTGFCYPVVPKGKARIRVQLSAAHSEADVNKAVAAFTKVGKALEVI